MQEIAQREIFCYNTGMLRIGTESQKLKSEVVWPQIPKLGKIERA